MRIGVLATAVGITTKTVRFYEHSGLVAAPPCTNAGYRDYPPEGAERLAFVRAPQQVGHVEQRIAELTQARVALQGLQRQAAPIDPVDCAESDICTILTTQAPSVDAVRRATATTTSLIGIVATTPFAA